MATLFPPRDAALAMSTLTDLVDHYRITREVWAAFIDKCGDPLNDLRMLAALPALVITEACALAQLPDGTTLSAIQASQIGLVYRLARRILSTRAGEDWDSWVDQDPWSIATTTPPSRTTSSSLPATTTTALVKERKLKDDTGVGPSGRLGVCGRDGDGEIGMASESHHLDRLSPSGGGGANVRTGKCPPQKGSDARFGAIHGLRSVGAIWCQSPQSLEVSIFHHDCGRVRDQGTSRARLFSAMEIVLQSLPHGLFDAEPCRSGHTSRLRNVHRKNDEAVPWRMAFDIPGRQTTRQGTVTSQG